MDKFGHNWVNYKEKIIKNWSKIDKDDLVLIPGDLSWSMNLEGAYVDFEFLSRLLGIKYMVKGNHDYCFKKENKAKEYLKSLDNGISKMRLIHRDSHIININNEKIGLVGTRGWSRGAHNIDQRDEKILNRELNYLEESFKSLVPISTSKIITLMHFPPTNEIVKFFIPDSLGILNNELSYNELYDDRFLSKMQEYFSFHVIFGHIHNISIKSKIAIGETSIYCVSADNINFNPIEIRI
jgi:hypothetical protein